MNRNGMSPAPAHLLQMMQMRGIGGSVIEGTYEKCISSFIIVSLLIHSL